MTLKTIVKVGNITSLSDARYCAGFGVHLLGFDIEPSSSHNISIDQASEIMGWIEGPTFVAECGNMSVYEIEAIINTNEIPCIQTDNLTIANQLINKGTQVIFQLKILDNTDIGKATEILAQLSDEVKYLLLFSENNDLTNALDQMANRWATTFDIIKSYGIKEHQIPSILAHKSIKGIELKGSHEEQPGLKTYDDLADILEALEVE